MGSVLIQLLLEFIISTLLRIQNLITLNKPIKSCCYLNKVKNIMFCKDKCRLIISFNNRYRVLFVQASSYKYLVQKLDLNKSKHLMVYNL